MAPNILQQIQNTLENPKQTVETKIIITFQNALYMVGGAVGFYSGDIRRLADDLSALKPTMMPAVPRLLNRLYDKAQSEISSSRVKKMLFSMALSAKESELKRYFFDPYF